MVLRGGKCKNAGRSEVFVYFPHQGEEQGYGLPDQDGYHIQLGPDTATTRAQRWATKCAIAIPEPVAGDAGHASTYGIRQSRRITFM